MTFIKFEDAQPGLLAVYREKGKIRTIFYVIEKTKGTITFRACDHVPCGNIEIKKWSTRSVDHLTWNRWETFANDIEWYMPKRKSC